MTSQIIALLFCLCLSASANEVYFEEKGEIAGNVGYFDSAFTFDLDPETEAVEEIQTVTDKLLNSKKVKQFKDICSASKTFKKWKKLEDKLNKRNDELEMEFKTIFHFGDVGTMDEEHNIVKRDFGISAMVFFVGVIIVAVGTTYGVTKALESNDIEGMKSAITDEKVRSDQMIEHTNVQDDKINELRDSLKETQTEIDEIRRFSTCSSSYSTLKLLKLCSLT